MAKDVLYLVMAAWVLTIEKYLDNLKCSPHKPVFRITISMDGTGRYRSVIDKSRPRIRAALK